ncbi:hypothetical protein Tco_0662351 [Tanacetum coccineum]
MVDRLKLARISMDSVDQTRFRGMVGSLMYLTASRPDLVFVYACVLDIRQRMVTKQAYADADHAGCQDSRRSTSGSAQFLGDRLVSWSSKKQRSTTISTTKAEYIAMSGCLLLLFACNIVTTTIALNTLDITAQFHLSASGKMEWLNSSTSVERIIQLADILTNITRGKGANFLLPRLGMKSLTPETLKRLQEGEDE